MNMLGIGIGIYSQILDEHLQPGVAGINPNAARPVGDPWLDGRDIPDHWDADSAA